LPKQKGFAVTPVRFIRRWGRVITRHQWTPEDRDYIRQEYRFDKASFNHLIRVLGVSEGALNRELSRLGLVKHSRLKMWGQGDLSFIMTHYDRLATSTIARILRRSECSVKYAVRLLKLVKCGRVGWFTKSDVSQILGVSQGWLDRRDLKFEKTDMHCGKYDVWCISESKLCAFIKKHPLELVGKNVDWVMIIEILAGVDTDIDDMRCLNGAKTKEGDNGTEKEIETEREMVPARVAVGVGGC